MHEYYKIISVFPGLAGSLLNLIMSNLHWLSINKGMKSPIIELNVQSPHLFDYFSSLFLLESMKQK